MRGQVWTHIKLEYYNITDMSRIFICKRFNEPIGNWNVGNVTDMNNMFVGSDAFNK